MSRAGRGLFAEKNGCPMKTKLIALEGIDGSGKGLQFAALKAALERRGRSVGTMDFPDYTGFFGKEIGKMLSGGGNVRADEADARSMALWYACDRFRAFRSFTDGEADFLLINRYVLSNAVYQSVRFREQNPGADAEAFAEWVFALEHAELGLPVPDIYFIFDVDAPTSKSNVAKKGRRQYTEDADVYERSESLMSGARELYLKLGKALPNARVIKCGTNGGMRAAEEITGELMGIIEERRLAAADK